MKIRVTLLEGNFEDREYMEKWAAFLRECGNEVVIQRNVSGYTPRPEAVDMYTATLNDDAELELQALEAQFDRL